MTALRLRGGKRAKRSRGGYAGGFVPLGKTVVSRDFADDPAAIARMRELRGQGRSLREIAAALTDEGHATKHGARWHPSTVARALAMTGTEDQPAA
ncbi:MAG TPA: recombinase family protein [Streptosporangiaceae bacterium]|nr:recombinase family protein [Streptosporangiaceae bacterium]